MGFGMMDELEGILSRLCAAPGASGWEDGAVKTAAKEFAPYAETSVDVLGNLTARMEGKSRGRRILLDAHIDQIGLIVTAVDKKGFLKVGRCGGTDRRVLPGTPVTVLGDETLTGIVCCMPPHLIEGDEADRVMAADKMAVDVGLSRKEAEKRVHPGDRILFAVKPRRLLGTRYTAAGLDNRVSVAAYMRCAQLLKEAELPCSVTFLLSTREEVGGQGASTGAYSADPAEAIAVDVGFAEQPGVRPEVSKPLGGGPMIGFAPILSRRIGGELVRIAKKKKIPFHYDVMGNSTGTNSDEIAVSRAGVPTGLVSIPLRYMHTGAEVVDLRDAENTAQLLAEYVRGVG